MKLLSVHIASLFLFISCSETKSEFDSNKWKKKSADWWMTNIREQMLNDLVKSDSLINRSKTDVIEILGLPEFHDSLVFKYLIREKYSNTIDPDYIKYLEIHFDNLNHSNSINIKTSQ